MKKRRRLWWFAAMLLGALGVAWWSSPPAPAGPGVTLTFLSYTNLTHTNEMAEVTFTVAVLQITNSSPTPVKVLPSAPRDLFQKLRKSPEMRSGFQFADLRLVPAELNPGASAIIHVPMHQAPPGGHLFSPTAPDGFTFSLYFGPGGSSAEQLVFSGATARVDAAPGILVDAARILALPGTEPGQVISLQVRASHPSGIPILNPPVRQATLGPTAGPGTMVWTTDPSTRTFYIAPEPGTLALAGVAGLLFGFARWRRR